MKRINSFVVDQKSLLSILSSMQPICSKKTTLEATSMIQFQVSYKEIVLKSTDLEISLQASCPIKDSTVSEHLLFLVSGKRIFEIVKEMDNDITISLDQNQLHLSSGSVKLALNIKEAGEFPQFPERIENLMHLNASLFLEMLNKVAFLIPQNNSNPALNGLLLEISDERMSMTSTDGHCLAQVTSFYQTMPGIHMWLMPRRAVFEVKKILETSHEQTIFLGTCNNQLVFSGESFNFFTKILADQFPQYAQVLDRTAFFPARIDRGQFLKTLRRSTCFLSGSFLATKFNFNKSSVCVSIENKDVGRLQEEISLHEFPGDDLDIRFYAPYLLNGLQVIDRDNITFYLKNNARPIIFENIDEKSNFIYLVMPVAPSNG